MPSFKIQVEVAIPQINGLMLTNEEDASKRLEIFECRQVVHIETSKGLPIKEGFVLDPPTAPKADRHVIGKPFLFGKHPD